MIEKERERYIKIMEMQYNALFSSGNEDLMRAFIQELMEGYIVNRALVEMLYRDEEKQREEH